MFSFSQGVKKEISLLEISARHCVIAETCAILNHCGVFEQGILTINTENVMVATRACKILKTLTQEKVDLSVKKGTKSTNHYSVRLENETSSENILKSAGLLQNGVKALAIDPLVVKGECCKRAYVRDAFLCSGSVSNPEKGYHFEIMHWDSDYLTKLSKIVNSFGLLSKVTGRKSHFILYIKEGEKIVDMLNIMGAHSSLMEMENSRILKDLRNNVTRAVNCETANIEKIVVAASKQLDDIYFLADKIGLSALPEGLEEVARLRMNYPDASLKEIGEKLTVPLGKSGVNHRLRKISNIAEFYRQ